MEYRILDKGEVIEDGDEWHVSNGQWVPSCCLGDKVRTGKYRRPVSVNSAPALPPAQAPKDESTSTCRNGKRAYTMFETRRYLVFMGAHRPFPANLNDVEAAFDTIEECEEYIDRDGRDYYEIVRLEVY